MTSRHDFRAYLIHFTLQWRHNERDGDSNHQAHDCLFNHLFRRWWKKTSKLRVTGRCEGNSPVTGEFPAQGPVTRKMFPFDDVIMKVYGTFSPRTSFVQYVTNNYGLNTLRPRQNGHHFPDDIFKWIFFNCNVWTVLRFHWNLFLRFELTIFQHWLR